MDWSQTLLAFLDCGAHSGLLIRFHAMGCRVYGICVNDFALARGSPHHVGVGLHMDVWIGLFASHFAACAYGAICTSNLDDCVHARRFILAVVRFVVPICALCVPIREHCALALVSESVIQDVSGRVGCLADELVAMSDRHTSTAGGLPKEFGMR